MARKIKTKIKAKPKQAKPTSQCLTKSEVKQIVRSTMGSGSRGSNSTWLGDLGLAAGNGISKIFGLGAYKINKNTLYSAQTGSQVPFMHSSSESFVFRHREYITDVSSSVGFSSDTFVVNPGDAITFPYLSTMAACFQEYRFRGIIFEFKSTSATALVNGTNTSMGTISLMAQYKADAPPPNSKMEILNSMWSVDGRISESFILPIECDPKENPIKIMYVRNGPVTGDIKMYDLCNVTLAAVGSPGVNIVGELWVSYEVEFYKPRLPAVGGLISAYHASRFDTAGTSAFGSIATTVYYTSGLVSAVSATSISFREGIQGKFLLTVQHVGGADVVIAAPGITFTNLTPVLWFVNNSVAYTYAPDNGETSNLFSYSVACEAAGGTVTPVITFGACTLPTNSGITITVTELPDDAV